MEAPLLCLLGKADATHQALLREPASRSRLERLRHDVFMELDMSTLVSLLSSENAVVMAAWHWLEMHQEHSVRRRKLLEVMRLSQVITTFPNMCCTTCTAGEERA